MIMYCHVNRFHNSSFLKYKQGQNLRIVSQKTEIMRLES
ncbi:hypothetical protein HNO89_004442, partial [Sporosarcina luteola]|nr:hypothetical protein [Sporosarcina luteola]